MNLCDVSEVYREMEYFYAGIQTELAGVGHDYKYRILYGPPFERPPIMWIGYQPGGDIPDDGDLSFAGVECDFACKEWTLALRMRGMFPISLLKNSVALNAIFVRSPNVKTYKRALPREIREKIFRFCKPQVEELTDDLILAWSS